LVRLDNEKIKMKKFKYNLFNINPPAGYRFSRKNEMKTKDFFWWIEKYQDKKDIINSITESHLQEQIGFIETEASPWYFGANKIYAGWIVKL
jgi:hypothetical protein